MEVKNVYPERLQSTFDKLIAWFGQDNLWICNEIYKCNLNNTPVNFGSLHNKFGHVKREREISESLQALKAKKVIRESWLMLDNKWVHTIHITNEFIKDLESIHPFLEE